MGNLAMDKCKSNLVASYERCLFLIMISSMVAGREFGLLSPIEVVEEWGCQDSDIRLTCSSLDSTIAILEATFKPNCSAIYPKFNTSAGEENSDCVHFDMKRLSPIPNASPKIDPKKTESIAGHKFLEALRQNHNQEKESTSPDPPTSQNVLTASFGSGIRNGSTRNDSKKRRMTLRASLEELLVEYLQGIAPQNDESIKHYARVKKRSVNSESAESRKSTTIMLKKSVKSAILNVGNSERIDTNIAYDEKRNFTNSSSSFCSEHRKQRITQLDRNELSNAIHNNSKDEFNIRKILNHRCSGKNHCSFVFSEDHPFSTIWSNGIVHIKYICMERYRVNKYCGEHLVLVNESPEPNPVHQPSSPLQRSKPKSRNKKAAAESDSILSERESPVAEALIQNDQMFHNLQILKSSPSELQSDGQRERPEKLKDAKNTKSNKGAFYSQDFRAMKILPANLDDFNDIERVGDEFSFRNEADAANINLNVLGTTVKPETEYRINTIDDQKVGYNEMHSGKKFGLPTSQPSTAPSYRRRTPSSNAWDNDLFTPNSNIFEIRTSDDDNIFVPSINRTHDQLVVGSKKNSDSEPEFTVINTDRAEDEGDEWKSDEEYDSSQEDDAVEINGPKISRKSHKSYQKTALRRPLLQQGFIASPAYPDFYIGDFNCSWRITAPNGHRIKLIILDVSLRYDSVCKDFLQIADIQNKRILFRSCTEMIMPQEILSESNVIQIALKTASTLLFPKRGFLIYYSVFGCIFPTAPKNGHIVSKSENAIKFLCDPSFIFSDTNENNRTLYCTKRNTWDKSLPNCVEHSPGRSGGEKPSIQSLWKQKKSDVTWKSDNDADDWVYDVLIPTSVILALLLVNAMILLVILRFRTKDRKTINESEGVVQL